MCAAHKSNANILVRPVSALGYAADIVGGLAVSQTAKAPKPVVRLGSKTHTDSRSPGTCPSPGFGAQVIALSGGTILSAIIFGLKS